MFILSYFVLTKFKIKSKKVENFYKKWINEIFHFLCLERNKSALYTEYKLILIVQLLFGYEEEL